MNLKEGKEAKGKWEGIVELEIKVQVQLETRDILFKSLSKVKKRGFENMEVVVIMIF